MEIYRSATWEELKKIPVGIVMVFKTYPNFYFMIVKGFGALCGYLGVPRPHLLASVGEERIPLECHGGLTFSGSFDTDYVKVPVPDLYFIGWDYAHYTDRVCFNEKGQEFNMGGEDETAWDVDMVIEDSQETIRQFSNFLDLIESNKNTEFFNERE